MKRDRLVIRTALLLVVRGGAAMSAFGLALVLALRLGAAEAGVFYLAVTAATIAATVGQLGLPAAVLRFVAESHAESDPAAAQGYVVAGRRAVLIASCVTGLCLAGLAPLLGPAFGLSTGASLSGAALGVPALAVLSVHTQALIGADRQLLAALSFNLLPPIITGGGIVLVADSAAAAIHIWVGTNLCCTWLSLVAWRRSSLEHRSAVAWRATAPLISTLVPSAIAMFVVAVGQLAISWSDTVALGVLGSASDVAVYASARQMAMVLSLVLVAVGSIFAPRFAACQRQNDKAALVDAARRATLFCTAATVPIAALMMVAPGQLLGLFGSEFVAGGVALRLLVTAQLINAMAGPVGYVLLMTGRERHHCYALVGAALANGVLNSFLVPLWGLAGAAGATLVAQVIFNALALWSAQVYLGQTTLPTMSWRFAESHRYKSPAR